MQRFMTAGIAFGSHGGLDAVHGLVLRVRADLDQFGFLTRATLANVETNVTFDSNPLYAVLHEAIYLDGPGAMSGWSAWRVGRRLPQFAWLEDPGAFLRGGGSSPTPPEEDRRPAADATALVVASPAAVVPYPRDGEDRLSAIAARAVPGMVARTAVVPSRPRSPMTLLPATASSSDQTLPPPPLASTTTAATTPLREKLYFTGEMIYPFHFTTHPELKRLCGAAELLALKQDWPALYDLEQLGKRNEVPVYAASFVDDMYVDFDLARETARAVRGAKVFETNVLYHNAIRARCDDVLRELFRLRDDPID
jgi:hypothetical protein